MSRAKWKGPYINPEQLLHFNEKKKQHVYIISRNSEIIPQFIGATFKTHNGKEYVELSIIDSMVGHKFGEFIFTRAKFSFKKKKQKNKLKWVKKLIQ